MAWFINNLFSYGLVHQPSLLLLFIERFKLCMCDICVIHSHRQPPKSAIEAGLDYSLPVHFIRYTIFYLSSHRRKFGLIVSRISYHSSKF